MKNLTSIIGLILIVAAVFGGYFMDFPQDWMLQVVAAAAGLALVISNQAKKLEKKAAWKAYLIGFLLAIGTILATYGGISESIITTIVGSLLVIAGIAVGVLAGVKNG